MKKIIYPGFILIVTLYINLNLLNAETFKCSKYVHKELQVEKINVCNDKATWEYGLSKIRKSNPELFEKKILKRILKENNMGASMVKFPSGKTKTIFRSSFLSESKECISALVKDRGVDTIVNLYSGEFKTNIKLAQKERSIFEKLGGILYVNFFNYTYKFKDLPKETIFKRIAQIIKIIEHSPGNVLVHCYGGMHRTGIVYGIIQKCVNKMPVETAVDEYKCHTAWVNEEKAGGYYKDNETVIREFPCDMLMELSNDRS